MVAARDVSPGQRLVPDDLEVARLTPSQVPAGSASSVEQLDGERVTVPLRSGEIVTDARLLSSALIRQYGRGFAATPIRIPDAGVVALLEAGDLVDVYAATGDQTKPADRVVSSAPVVAVPSSDGTSGEGAVVVLALNEADSARIAQANATTQLSISIR